jgi:DNA-directed RNA polymerase
MRYKDSLEQQSYLKQASRDGCMELVFASLDVLGSTPWQINRAVFDVVLQVWNSGERMGKVPPAVYDMPEPVPPENVDTDIKARSVHLQRMKSYHQSKANNHSDRCSVNYKIEIARAVSLGFSIFHPFCYRSNIIHPLVLVPRRHDISPAQRGLSRPCIPNSTTSEPHR